MLRGGMHGARARPTAPPPTYSAGGGLSLRLFIVVLLSIGLGWLVFAVLFHEDIGETSSEDGIVGAMPGKPVVKRRNTIHGSIGPVVKPKGGS